MVLEVVLVVVRLFELRPPELRPVVVLLLELRPVVVVLSASAPQDDVSVVILLPPPHAQHKVLATKSRLSKTPQRDGSG